MFFVFFDKKFDQENNLCKHVAKTINIWHIRQLAVKEWITVFKLLALSRFTHLVTIEQLCKMQKNLCVMGKMFKKIKNKVWKNLVNGGF